MICKEKRGLETSLLSIFPQYSFLLSILVVLVHSTHFSVEELQGVARLPFLSSSFLEKWEFFFSEFLGQVAVPGFFFVSGYLFFHNLESLSQWREKLRKRFFSYVLPYLFWNTGMTALYLLFRKAEFSVSGILGGIFLYRYQPVFWYFFQLILLTYACPFLAWGLLCFRKFFNRKIGNRLFFFFPLCFLLLVFLRFDIPYLNEDAAFYYSFGAFLGLFYTPGGYLGLFYTPGDYLGLFYTPGSFLSLFCISGMQKSDSKASGMISGTKSARTWPTPLAYFSRSSIFLLITALLCYAYTIKGQQIGFLLLATVLYRMAMAIVLLLLCQRGFFSFGKKFAENNFFLYASHYIFLRLWFMLQKYIFPEAGEALLFCFYTLSPLYCLLLSQLSGYFLKKYAQVLWKLVNGGRG